MTGRRRPRKGRRQTQDAAVSGLDMGTDLAIERKTVEVDPNAAVPVDPDSPRSRMRLQPQARRVWAIDQLTRGQNPALQMHHHDAATTYLEDWLIGEHGANPNPRSGPSTRLDPWNRMPYVEQRAIRSDRWRKANRALGPGLFPIVAWTVLQQTPNPETPPTAEAWAKARQPKPWRTERAVGLLIAALEILALYYGYGTNRTQRGRPAG